jgi:hypothetical protein
MRREGLAQRLDAEAFEQGVALEPVGGNKIHEAEASRVAVTDRSAIAEMKHDMLMLRCIGDRVRELTWRVRLAIGVIDGEAARHAKMHDEHRAVIQPREQIFGAAVQRLDFSPG